jgi:LmbE family N-acetylglucosaminyl deacetylase
VADVVVLAPHMDDETLGCGGILALAQDPLVVFAVSSPDETIEVGAVARILGFRYTVLYGSEHEARLLSLDRREFVARVEKLLHAESPRQVFIPSPSYHQDHNVVFEVGVAATRPLSREGYIAQMVAAYEYPGSAWRRDGGEDRLNYYVDVEKAMERKLEAVSCYRSQQGRKIVDVEVVRAWARLRGEFVGIRYAEAFQILRLVA